MKLIVALVVVVAATASGKVISGPEELRSAGYGDNSKVNDDDIIECIAKILKTIKWDTDSGNGGDDDDDGNGGIFAVEGGVSSTYVTEPSVTSTIALSRSAHRSVNKEANHNKGNNVHGQGKAHGNAHDKGHGKAHAKSHGKGKAHDKSHAKSHDARNHNKKSKIDKTNKNHQ
ncbi:PREDICTED: kininogen-2-like [Nicrophorus vespilloides]|uniref:Kininogen-2-like n=1 Tax=Nicrophorus vespilloides TaxID=110193 RepID=A0ABM1NHS7_NICVS|nr:PREDICTED: kininogen-2-like [Nicrophorus vespilloides]